jgi:galactonate dehydratase
MKITALEAFALREPGSGRTYSLLKVSSDQALVGWGECTQITPASLELAKAAAIGQEPSRYDVLTRQLSRDPIAAAVNMAMLDLYGQESKAPVFQLLGGPTRFKVRAMTTLARPEDREALLAQGHRAFLVPVTLPATITSRPNVVAQIASQFAALRKSSGDNVDFAADGQALLPSAEAADLALALEPYHPLWFDRPTREPNEEVLARIAAESTTPLGLGHHLNEFAPVQNYLRDGICDILRLSINRLGITPLRRAAAIAETYYTAIAPHHTGGPIGTAAALHLAASLPNFFIQEVPVSLSRDTRQFRDELVGGPIETVKDGYFSLSTKPGLGLNVNESLIRRLTQ